MLPLVIWEAVAATLPAGFTSKGTGYKPVADGVSALLGVLPNARVTSGYRSPTSALSRANPGSWHSKSHAAVDIAPIPGMSYQDAYNKLAGQYGIIEARDEQAHPLPWTTGPNWHFVLGNR